MTYLVDTMTFVRAFADGLDALPRRVRNLLRDPKQDFLLSTVSLSEIAIKTAIGKLNFSFEHVAKGMADLRFTLLAYKERHVQALFSLPWFADHRDPFDRMLIAVAVAQELPIIGGDKHFSRYRGIKVIWN